MTGMQKEEDDILHHGGKLDHCFLDDQAAQAMSNENYGSYAMVSHTDSIFPVLKLTDFHTAALLAFDLI